MTIPHQQAPTATILALGLTQIIGYGTLYYCFSILAPDMARDLGWSVDQVFGVFSGALLVGGVVAPVTGRWMDRFGASRLMVAGSIFAALTLAMLASSSHAATYTFSLIALELAAAVVLYPAAFATLVEIAPHAAARSITYLTLIAGFSSTLFWPLTTWLHGWLTWREIFLLYAALNVVICLPLHYWIVHQRRAAAGRGGDESAVSSIPVQGSLPPSKRRLGFLLASGAFALQGFTLSAMLVHMVPMLTTLGLGASAVMVGALFGPSQVLSRFINMVFGRNIQPPMLAVLSAFFMVSGIVVLFVSGSWLPGAIVFAALLGLGSGINSIVQGSLPLYLFGSEGYGTVTGQMSALRLILSSTAPFVFAVISEQAGTSAALAVTASLGTLGMLGFAAIRRGT
jgi:predicted MFS family arabinose efflux permease